MPTPALPLTPATSTEIPAKDEKRTSPLQPNLCLPPPALPSGAERGHASQKATNTTSTCYINSANAPTLNPSGSASSKSRRQVTKAERFNLPSPPTCSRKIIQMKPPQPHAELQFPNKRRKTASTACKSTASTVTATISSSTPSTASGGSKPTKKAIRKTAHSLIERRRRSKMNDAFSTLKDMIPACQGGDDEKSREMHKLDVLNAGIEYLAYLERCLKRMNGRGWDKMEEDTKEMKEDGGLQEQENSWPKTATSEKDSTAQPHASSHQCHCRCHQHSSPIKPHPRTDLPPSLPPSLGPRPQAHHSTATATATATISPSFSHSDQTSINRIRDRDQEQNHDAAATASTAAALLMLTSTDRRNTRQISAPNATNSRGVTDDHQHHATTRNGSWNHQHSPEAATKHGPTPGLAAKAGLSVRDLLSSV